MQNLEGKTVVFFGATGGIGESVCREFRKEGANLVLVARSQDKLAKLKEELGGQNNVAISADATSLTEVQKVFRESNDRFGQVDAVVISVGTWIRTSLANSPQEIINMNEKLDASIAKPVIVVGSVAQEFMRKQGRGEIFHMSSHAADSYLHGNLAYASAKAKASRFILNLGEELKGTGVSTCDIRPALVDTPQNREGLPQFSKEEWAKAVQPIDIAEFVAEHIVSSNIPAIKFFESGIEAK
jgi:NADP-dependent 3-hydroxy acid dehydrogenase YdfG